MQSLRAQKTADGYPFVAGVDAGLKKWLEMRREVRESRVNGKNFETLVQDVSDKRRKDWLKHLHNEDNKEEESASTKIPYHVLELVIKNNVVPKEVILMNILETRSLQYLSKAISAGIHVNSKFPSNGRILLHSACYLGDVKKVQFLLEAGSAVNAQDMKKSTPLHLSIQPISAFHSKEIVLKLLEYHADPNILDEKDRNPLHYAVIIRSEEYIRLLISAGANICAIDYKGKIPFDYAIQKEKFEDICFQYSSEEMYLHFKAKLVARQFTIDIFDAVISKCRTCCRSLGTCALLKKQNLRYWLFTHGKLKNELNHIKRKW